MANFGDAPYASLKASGLIPEALMPAWESIATQALDAVRETFSRVGHTETLRLHGDCHIGNVLWTDSGPHFVDLDDACMGPAIQDLWMLLSGDREACSGQMGRLLREAIRGGAAGLSTSYLDIDENMKPVPSRWARHEELEALCSVLGEKGRMLQIVHEFFDADLTIARVEQLAELSLRHGITTTLSPLFHSAANHEGLQRVMRVEVEGVENGLHHFVASGGVLLEVEVGEAVANCGAVVRGRAGVKM